MPTDYLEEVVQIIMITTGYERDEIEPEMDIRMDLAIRSSRLPVILDELDQRFGVFLRIDDFADARTVSEIARRVKEKVEN